MTESVWRRRVPSQIDIRHFREFGLFPASPLAALWTPHTRDAFSASGVAGDPEQRTSRPPAGACDEKQLWDLYRDEVVFGAKNMTVSEVACRRSLGRTPIEARGPRKRRVTKVARDLSSIIQDDPH